MSKGAGRPSICIIPGEGAAAEAIEAILPVLQTLAPGLNWVRADTPDSLCSGRPTISLTNKAAIDAADATLFGATAGAYAATLLYLRWGKRTFANVRPFRWSPGMAKALADPAGVDFVIVRENLEDAYVAVEGTLSSLPRSLVSPTVGHALADMGDGAYSVKAITRAGSERVVRAAFALARARQRTGRPGRVTASAKGNMLPRTDGLFLQVASEVAREFPDIAFETLIVDDCAHRLCRAPQRFDVIVLPYLYGDLLSDMAAGLVGGLGVAPSACLGDDYAYFEPAHGTAPDIAGRGIVNPVAALLSGAMLLDHLDRGDAATTLRSAVDRLHADGRVLTQDAGGASSTTAVVETILDFALAARDEYRAGVAEV